MRQAWACIALGLAAVMGWGALYAERSRKAPAAVPPAPAPAPSVQPARSASPEAPRPVREIREAVVAPLVSASVPAEQAREPGVLTAWTPEVLRSLEVPEGWARERAREVLEEERKALLEGLRGLYLERFAPAGEDPARVRQMPFLAIMSLLKPEYDKAAAMQASGVPPGEIPYFSAWEAFLRGPASEARERTYREMALLMPPAAFERFRGAVHRPGVFDFGSDGISIVIDVSKEGTP